MLDRVLLAPYGYEVSTVYSALDCIQRLRESPPDLLLLDYELQWGGAEGVLAWMREQERLTVPVILLTGIDQRPGCLPPIVDVLPKPVLRAMLLKAVQAVIVPTDRRAFPRKAATGSAVVRLQVGKTINAALIDMSPSGLCLDAEYGPSIDDELEVEMVPTTRAETLSAPVRVRNVRSQGSRSLIGCEFLRSIPAETLTSFCLTG